MSFKRIRGGSGLGDSLYVRPVAEYFAGKGVTVEVLSDYPDVFLGARVKVEPFGRNGVNVLAHYSGFKSIRTTTQWDDVCKSARLPHTLPLEFKWCVRNGSLVRMLRNEAAGRPLLLLHGGRIPMNRKDGFGKELLPNREAFLAVLSELSHCFVVRVGKEHDQVYTLPANKVLTDLKVRDLIDLAVSCDGLVSQCSFAVPLAEVFDKPLLAVWAESGLRSSEPFVNSITPQKILHKSSSRWVSDGWSLEQIRERVHSVFGTPHKHDDFFWEKRQRDWEQRCIS